MTSGTSCPLTIISISTQATAQTIQPAYMNDNNGGLWKSDGTTNGTVFFMPGQTN